MEERAIHISSINREKRGTSRPGDFTIKFNPSLKLDPEKKHQLALDRLSMTYSWYNIRTDYENNRWVHTKLSKYSSSILEACFRCERV